MLDHPILKIADARLGQENHLVFADFEHDLAVGNLSALTREAWPEPD
jgi:hypothetical protein